MMKIARILIVLVGMLMSYQVSATVNIQPGIGGTWVVPGEDGHGLFINMTKVGSEDVFVVSWYHYLNGQQIFLIGSISYQPGAESVTVPMIITSGADFGDNFNQSDVVRTDWGTLTFRFTDCDAGEMDYASGVTGFGSGTKTLTRLTNTAGVACQASQASIPAGNSRAGSLIGRNFDGVIVRSEQLVTKSSLLSGNQSACHLQVSVENTTNENKNFVLTYNALAGGTVISTAAVLNTDFSAGSNNPANQTVILEGVFSTVSVGSQGQTPDLADICNGVIPDTQPQQSQNLQCDQIDETQGQSVTELFIP